jgi:hypothetical protein
MDSHAVHSAEPQQLAKLLDPDSDAPTIYHGTDPGRILRDQLQAPLSEELSSSIAGMRVQMDLAPTFLTFDDLFHDPHPPIEALKRAKDYAKTCRGNHELLPSEVATVLYYAALAAARVHLDETITHLSDEELRSGLQWSISQAWVDEKTKGLFREGLGRLGH